MWDIRFALFDNWGSIIWNSWNKKEKISMIISLLWGGGRNYVLPLTSSGIKSWLFLGLHYCFWLMRTDNRNLLYWKETLGPDICGNAGQIFVIFWGKWKKLCSKNGHLIIILSGPQKEKNSINLLFCWFNKKNEIIWSISLLFKML